MIISEETVVKIVIAILGFAGFWVAKYIHQHKKADSAPLVCPLKFNCHAVVHSDYSRFLGVPLEIYGMSYYAFIFLAYVYLSFISLLPLPMISFLIALSFIAFLFSLYLTFVQIFILKEGCFWCFVSAILSIIIFILTFISYDLSAFFPNLPIF